MSTSSSLTTCRSPASAPSETGPLCRPAGPLGVLRGLVALGLVATLAGCPATSESDGQGDVSSDDPAPAAATTLTAADVVGKTSERESPAGRWLMVVVSGAQTMLAGVVEIDPEVDPPMTFVSTTQQAPGWAVKSAELEGDTLRGVIQRDGGTVDLVGTLRDGRIDGTLSWGNSILSDMQLVAYDGETVSTEGFPAPPPGFQLLELNVSEGGNAADALELAKKYEGSPVVRQALRVAMTAEARDGNDEASRELRKRFLDESAAWGPPREARAALAAVTDLVGFSDPSLDEVDALVKRALDADREGLSQSERYQLEITPLLVAVERGERLDEARAFIERSLATFPYDPTLYNLRAALVEQTEDREDDLELATEVSMLPSLSGNDETVVNLYRDVRGSLEGIEEYADTIYRAATRRFATEDRDEATAGNTADQATDDAKDDAEDVPRRTVLLEMFTGGQCAPCVATDIALDAVDKTYGDEVVVLRYHQHVPGPDPLTTGSSQNRYDSYGVEGTPTVFANGVDINPRKDQRAGMYGPINFAPAAYAYLKSVVETKAVQPSSLRIEGSARWDNKQMVLELRAEGFEESEVDDLIVHAALVKEEVKMRMPNGVLFHENVLRHMLTGTEGLTANDDKTLEGAGRIGAGDLWVFILDAAAPDGLQLSSEQKSILLDLHDLSVVAFVQNRRTQDVLAVTQFPVEGTPIDPPEILLEERPDALQRFIDESLAEAEARAKARAEAASEDATSADETAMPKTSPEPADSTEPEPTEPEAMKDEKPSSEAAPRDEATEDKPSESSGSEKADGESASEPAETTTENPEASDAPVDDAADQASDDDAEKAAEEAAEDSAEEVGEDAPANAASE